MQKWKKLKVFLMLIVSNDPSEFKEELKAVCSPHVLASTYRCIEVFYSGTTEKTLVDNL